MLINVHFFSPLVKKGLEVICLNFLHQAADFVFAQYSTDTNNVKRILLDIVLFRIEYFATKTCQ